MAAALLWPSWPNAVLSSLVTQSSAAKASAEGLTPTLLTFLSFVFRFDEAALSIQKEKNIYKEIENYPTCYKVFFENA